MFKSPLTSAAVLILGLVSCAPERKSNDVYNAPPPTIRTSGSGVGLKEWDRRQSRQYDLQDTLDFAESHPKRIEVKTECRLDDGRIFGKFSFANESQIAIWRMLPNEVLTANFMRATFDCAFELTLFDEAGSNHVFNITPVEVTEERPAPAQIAHEATLNPKGLLKLTPQSQQDVRLRFVTTAPSSAQLICESAQLPPLAFDQVLDLAHFQFPSSDELAAHPVQLCRAVVSQSGRRVAYSNLIQFGWAPPQVLISDETPPLPDLSFDQFDRIVQTLRTAASLPLSRWRFHNSERITRYFRFNRARSTATTSLYVRASSPPLARMSFDFAIVQTLPQANIVKDAWSTVTAVLPPYSDLIVVASAQSQTPLQCRIVPEFQAVGFDNFAPITITEVGKDGTTLSTFTLQPKPRIWSATSPLNFASAASWGGCNWY